MATIESFVQPLRLYRYRSLQNLEREIRAIENAYIHCAQFTSLNDPMEGMFSSSHRFRVSEEYSDIKKLILEHKSLLRISSFSEVQNHELMWAVSV
jgi:hypothetical protein